MWVWIPRYAYQIENGYHLGAIDGGTINVKFLKNTTDTASDGTTSWNNASGQGNWNVHPAFSYGSNVAGIWVAKFEASRADATSSSIGSSNTIKVQPTVQSWRSITANDIYNTCINYNKTLNSHMIKNSEWGAVVYLAQSAYGKNNEVWINNSSSLVTGSSGDSATAEQNVGTTTDYTSSQGVQASTTGNVTGIYDMSGGAWEYTAAYLNNGHENLKNYATSLVNGEVKTKDIYNVGSSDFWQANYEAAAGTYGDAIFETSSMGNGTTAWYDGYANFSSIHLPLFCRGGGYDNSNYASLYAYSNESGIAGNSYGFRPVLVVL